MSSDQAAKARAFRALHENGPLVLPNAWDPGSARAIEAAGAKAVATTSAGVSWAEGVSDGGGLTRPTALAVLRRIAAVVTVPITADLETGYGVTPAEVGETVAEVIEIGVVGINLEDSVGQELVDPSVLAERIAAAREAAVASGIELVINARTDTHLFGDGSGTLERAACTPKPARTFSSYQASSTQKPSANSWPAPASHSTSWPAQAHQPSASWQPWESPGSASAQRSAQAPTDWQPPPPRNC